jgi:hypothetical protein
MWTRPAVTGPTHALAAVTALVVVVIALDVAGPKAQRGGVFSDSRDHPAIKYSTQRSTDRVGALAQKLEQGALTLAFAPDNGYLESILEALDVPVDSQVAVFSQTSSQASIINPRNPRTLYFNDAVAIGWVRGAEHLELVAHDKEQGAIFYTIEQRAADRPRLKRDNACLACHLTWDTLGVPGLMVLSVYSMPEDQYSYASGSVTDHRSTLAERWGGWFVTSRSAPPRHLWNVHASARGWPTSQRVQAGPSIPSLEGLFDARGFPSLHSDIAALVVLEHQAHMMNLITRMGWEARVAAHLPGASPIAPAPGRAARPARDPAERLNEAATELVDYLLMVDETPYSGAIRGSSTFAERFSQRGPKDRQGRSLYQLDLERRLLRHRCSYMIYSEAFQSLPPTASDAVYRRLWHVLSGQETGSVYASLTRTQRETIVEILRDTVKGLPDYFGQSPVLR